MALISWSSPLADTFSLPSVNSRRDNIAAVFGDCSDPFGGRFQLRSEDLALEYGFAFRDERQPFWGLAQDQVDDHGCGRPKVQFELVVTDESHAELPLGGDHLYQGLGS